MHKYFTFLRVQTKTEKFKLKMLSQFIMAFLSFLPTPPQKYIADMSQPTLNYHILNEFLKKLKIF